MGEKNKKENQKYVPKEILEKQINQKTIAKKCWLSRYKRSRSNEINYMFVPPKYKTKNNQENIKAVPKTILEKQINQIK